MIKWIDHGVTPDEVSSQISKLTFGLEQNNQRGVKTKL